MRDPLRELNPGTVWEVEDLRARRYRSERFNRMRYARRVLDALRPDRVDVLLVQGVTELRVERGHRWGHPIGHTWAMVTVPPVATREEIALALMELAGSLTEPYVLHALLALDED